MEGEHQFQSMTPLKEITELEGGIERVMPRILELHVLQCSNPLASHRLRDFSTFHGMTLSDRPKAGFGPFGSVVVSCSPRCPIP
jgi:hypothetical protein